MAITATIALSASTVTAEQQVTATCTISNSGAAAVNVLSLAPLLNPSGQTVQSVSAAIGVPPIGGAFPVTVPASGTLPVSFTVTPHAPTSGYINAQVAQFAYSVGALISTTDGALTTATPATLTVNNPALQ